MAEYPPMKANVAEAFDEYVELGPKRSYRALAEKFRLQTDPKPPTKRLKTISDWAVKFQWQMRLGEAINKNTQKKLERANELDADTFLHSSEKLNDAIKNASDPREIVSIRESVRKSEPKTSVDVTHSGTIKHAHHDMSGFTDEEIDTLAEIAKRKKAEVHL